MFVSERTLLVGMALNAGSIRSSGQSRLLQFKAAMWIMAVATPHHALKHFVMKRFLEIGLHFTMTTNAQLRFALPQH
jgi:hypothetical protein